MRNASLSLIVKFPVIAHLLKFKLKIFVRIFSLKDVEKDLRNTNEGKERKKIKSNASIGTKTLSKTTLRIITHRIMTLIIITRSIMTIGLKHSFQ
jgi:hypothetical protein